VAQIPALFANEERLTYVEELAVVGSVGNLGFESSFSNKADFVSVYAPGENVQYPYWNEQGSEAYAFESGTSSGM
jgi:hypothetical protein